MYVYTDIRHEAHPSGAAATQVEHGTVDLLTTLKGKTTSEMYRIILLVQRLAESGRASCDESRAGDAALVTTRSPA